MVKYYRNKNNIWTSNQQATHNKRGHILYIQNKPFFSEMKTYLQKNILVINALSWEPLLQDLTMFIKCIRNKSFAIFQLGQKLFRKIKSAYFENSIILSLFSSIIIIATFKFHSLLVYVSLSLTKLCFLLKIL